MANPTAGCASTIREVVNEGYSDIRHIGTALQKHDQSEEHKFASLKLKLLGKRSQTIQNSLNSAYRENILKQNEIIKENRDIIRRLIDMIIFLGTQEQALRGHDESQNSLNQGNFKELANLLSKFDDKFKKFLDESSVFSGLSKTIQNDLIDSINKIISQIISAEIKQSPCFSWQVDETTDIQCLSQLSVIFRYVTNGKIVERFMGFFNDFDLANKLIGQTYDGASVMSGELNGLQSKIKNVASQALFIHCYAHRMNLILQDSATFFSKSTKRTKVLDEVGTARIPSGSDTRWNYKSRTINVIINERSELLEVFEYILNSDEFSRDQESIRAAVGFKNMRLYKEILDLIMNQIDIRFKDLEFLAFLDLLDKSKFTLFKKKFPHDLLDLFLKTYPKLFIKNILQNELQVWYSDPDIFGNSSNYSDITEFVYTNELQSDVPEIYKLLCVALSLPASSASVERSFSTLKRIKTFSRNSMDQFRLSNLATIAIERGLVKYLQDNFETSKFYDNVIDHFALSKNRRIDLIYKQ
ncbi:zinc finger MYM-type protein 1-like [Zophobas morio]|uniref:zinc finger MYM-type protein 1-like n=1 Tax=Zophobas morio TaxID=2755281 RepID=UPI003083A083